MSVTIRRLTGGNDRFANPATGQFVIYGLDGDDTITTSITRRDNTPDVFFGGGGRDRITAGRSDDRLFGGAGDDTLDGGEGNDLLDGDADDRDPNDTLFGNDQLVLPAAQGNDLLDGGLGDDTIFGRGGNDTLRGGFGTDILVGGDGNDLLDGGGDSRSDTLDGGAGNDTLLGSFGDNLLIGGAGADSIRAGTGADTLFGDAGDDALDAGDGDDLLAGGAGADTLDGGGGFDIVDYSLSPGAVLVQLASTAPGAGGDAAGDRFIDIEGAIGSAGGDILAGTAGANLLRGLGGNDSIIGGAGADTLDGGSGNDLVDYRGTAAGVNVDLAAGLVTGGDTDSIAGFETVFGSLAGNDTLTGDAGANLLVGFGGNDVLAGGAGPDTLDGGDGIDTADFSASPNRPSPAPNLVNGVVVVLGARVTTGTGSHADGDVVLTENVIGSAFNDSILGAADAAAAPVDNRLAGGAGNDTIFGFAGNDTLVGGAGRDTLVGGAGADRFVYALASESPPSGPDLIADFSQAQADKVDLSGLGVALGFIGTAAFGGVGAPELRFQNLATTASVVEADLNGDGGADLAILFQHAAPITFVAGDFIV